METLIINAGSSSIKFRVYKKDSVIVTGQIDRIGEKGQMDILAHGKRKNLSVTTKDYRDAGALILKNIPTRGIKVVGHRVVHGGIHRSPVRITRQVMVDLWQLIPLAPLHLPPALELIEYFHEKLNAESVACFDTSFHATMPKVAKLYAIPRKYSDEGIIRYGFHGLAHRSMMEKYAELSRKEISKLNLITCQLGSGISVCAIKNGKSIDTTMGFTPLEGLPMGTRSGNVDPSIVSYLEEKQGLLSRETLHILENKSGLLALGGSHDVRDLLDRERTGDKNAKLALDYLAYHLRKTIGAYYAILERVDAVILAGGLSQAPAIRYTVLSGLHHLGIDLDMENFWRNSPVKIGSGDVESWVVNVDEEHEIYRMTSGFM